jgi:hypothetical protein
LDILYATASFVYEKCFNPLLHHIPEIIHHLTQIVFNYERNEKKIEKIPEKFQTVNIGQQIDEQITDDQIMKT